MATEKIVSPGVFTREIDQSFLPQAIANIGAAIIGPTIKGPAMVPTVVNSFNEFVEKFGNTNPNYYVPYTAKEYLAQSGPLTIVRTLHDDGYTLSAPVAVVATGSFGKRHIAMLHPSQVVNDSTANYNGTNLLFISSSVASNVSGAFVLTVSGAAWSVDISSFPNAKGQGSTFSSSLVSTNANYLTKVFSQKPTTTVEPVYLYTMFNKAASQSLATDNGTSVYLEIGGVDSFDYSDPYSNASTPWIISQTVSATNYNLFKFHTISDGVASNYEFKVGITNIKAAGTVPGSEYGSFTVVIRAVDQTKLSALGSPFDYDDSDIRPNTLEVFNNVNLDPNSANYIARVIGDRYLTLSSGKVIVNGDYPNRSAYVYVEMDDSVTNGAISPELVPFGFAALYNPVPSGFTNIPSASYVADQKIGGIYNKRKYWGFDFDFNGTDNINYLKSLPISSQLTVGNNVKFLLSNYNQDSGANFPSAAAPYTGAIDLTTNTSINSRQFLVPFQGGFDGIYPNRRNLVGSDIIAGNTQGYDLSSVSAPGYSVYTNAIDTVSNPDEIDINMVVLPGVIYSLHPSIIAYADDMVNDRGDAFLVFDSTGISADIDDTVGAVEAYDSNYSATYYPWIKILDTGINKPVWVPPSVVIPGVLAFNDKVAAEWFAPAGLNRGGLTQVLEAYTRLTLDERDTLYEGRVNPIASFPGTGVCVWGQKTLQAKPSALDRINVRRLLIAVKKFIASSTKYLVFEQNTAATRNRFLNIVNPYLESIQQRQGLYAFRVVMDESNNTPDVIDRNIMYGQIFLQPTKTAEFIILDFNILRTGASFSQ